MMMNSYPLDPCDVEAYFQAQGVSSVVGLTSDDLECPLACSACGVSLLEVQHG